MYQLKMYLVEEKDLGGKVKMSSGQYQDFVRKGGGRKAG